MCFCILRNIKKAIVDKQKKGTNLMIPSLNLLLKSYYSTIAESTANIGWLSNPDKVSS